LFQYRSAVLPVMLVASVFGAKRVLLLLERACGAGAPQHWRAALLAFVATTSVLSNYFFSPSPISRIFDVSVFVPGPRSAAIEQAGRMIPRSASLAATEKAALHFTRQRELWVIPRRAEQADYVLLDLGEPISDWEEAFRCRDKLLRNADYGLRWFHSFVLLFRRGYARDALDELIRVPPSEAVHATGTPVNEFINLLDIRVRRVGNAGQRLSVLWQCRKETTSDFCPVIKVIDDRMGVVATIGPYPMLYGIHPTFLWKRGEAFRESFPVRLSPVFKPTFVVELIDRSAAPQLAIQLAAQR